MARQYRFVVTYVDGSESSLWFHDDNTLELDSVKVWNTPDGMSAQAAIRQQMVEFCRKYAVDHLHCKKI